MKTEADTEPDSPRAKWQRRAKKKRPKMAVHGRGLKKLAAHLDNNSR